MKIIYTTDLHGDNRKYDELVNDADELHPDVVINGGDMFPKNIDLHKQDAFIKDKLQKHFEKFEQLGIHYLCYPGNDDLRIFDGLFQDECSHFDYIHDIAQNIVTIKDIDFIGMNWVVDYPFRLKDRCRMDNDDYRLQMQYGTALLSAEGGWTEIIDWPGYIKKLPTIHDELENLPKSGNEKVVYIIHMPPSKLGLDVCMDGRTVGSDSIYDFVRDRQPLFSLHGHIHESPNVSGKWKNKVDNTIVIQPGQTETLVFVVIDTETMSVERFIR